MGSINYHKLAIDILLKRSSFTNEDLLLEIAKARPSAIVKAAKKLGHSSDPVKQKAIKAIKQANSKVQAIRFFREGLQMGLRESKEYIEKVQEEEGLYPTEWRTSSYM